VLDEEMVVVGVLERREDLRPVDDALTASAKKNVLPAFAVPAAAARGPFGSQRMSLTWNSGKRDGP
jgi:hypothetical protein